MDVGEFIFYNVLIILQNYYWTHSHADFSQNDLNRLKKSYKSQQVRLDL